MESTPVHVARDYTLREIADLAHKSGRPVDQHPLGFIKATLSFTVQVFEETNADGSCAASLRTELSASLQDRTIEVARDIADDKCFSDAVIAHYLKIAQADEGAVRTQSRRLAHEISTQLTNALEQNLAPSGESAYRDFVIELAKSVIDKESQSTLQLRLKAQETARDADNLGASVERCKTNAVAKT